VSKPRYGAASRLVFAARTEREHAEASRRRFRHGGRDRRPNIRVIEFETARMERAMWTQVQKIGKGVVLAGAIAGLTLTTTPTTAHAGGIGAGAAIGLGVLGGVLAGAAIASTPPVYAAPSAPGYYYPTQPYYQGYYAPPPTYYPTAQPYYGYDPYYR